MVEIDYRNFDKAADMLRRLRNPNEVVDFGLIQEAEREPLVTFLVENGFVVPDLEHQIYWWNGREFKSKYTIDIYLPVYKVVRPFVMREVITHDKRCAWDKDDFLLLDYDLRFWFSDRDPEL